ncbi:DUF3006 family protein [Bacillaceae bacterium SIJ1]|uniref:DUF3006 family protein n=1 Tax=Litoribacterium kuwaitense TaxID=1398745 RepID=UPI0013EC04AF|nr:DUF3006 family protein [Litoribacterium kuwaitense]NGP44906.1 DUF3006 family protein [Litoribacterium kuwaitense]
MDWGVIDRIGDDYATILIGDDAKKYYIRAGELPKKVTEGMRCFVKIEEEKVVQLIPDVKATREARSKEKSE